MVVDQLGKLYGEATIGQGLANTGGIIELFVSKDGQTWTIVITRPDFKTCVVASGFGWEKVKFVLRTGAEM